MEGMEPAVLRAWGESSSEGVLVANAAGCVCSANARACELLGLSERPASLTDLRALLEAVGHDVSALFEAFRHPDQPHSGELEPGPHVRGPIAWQAVPLRDGASPAYFILILRDVRSHSPVDGTRQAFLSMVSHDLRTPLSAILGFAELLQYHRGNLSDDEQTEFVDHIIKNATALHQYTQIALDILYLEADQREFETEGVKLDLLVERWLSDALHRFPPEQFAYVACPPKVPTHSQISPAATHRILNILAEFAAAEAPDGDPIALSVTQRNGHVHVLVEHRAPSLSRDEAAALFRLLHPRDLTAAGRPSLHRMQLYVASLLATRQHGRLSLHSAGDHRYTIDLALPLAPGTDLLP